MSKRIDALDGLRGLAILMVIYQHAFAREVGERLVAATGLSYPYLVGNAWMGVSLFFILSGFVLALPYFQGERSFDKPGSVRAFYDHRAKRLLPLYFFMCFVSYAFTMVSNSQSPKALGMALTSLSMFSRDQFFPAINGPFWSLLVEIWFCVFFPYVMRSMMAHGPVKVLGYLLLFCAAFRIGGAYFTFVDVHVNPVKDFVLARLDDFAVGMVVAYLFARGQLKLVSAALLIVVGVSSFIVCCLMWDLRVMGKMPLWITAFGNNLSQVAFGCALILALRGGWWREILQLWWLRLSGAMCFSIYCWHGILMRPAFYEHPFGIARLAEFCIALFILSAFTYRFIEFRGSPNTRDLFRLNSRN